MRARVRGRLFETVRELALRLIPGAKGAYRTISEKNKLFIDVVSHLKGARVFLDSSKDPIRLKYLMAEHSWQVKAIHLIRDGRATAASFLKHDGMTIADAATEWRRTHEECKSLMKWLPRESWLTVHYENLCHNPDQVLADIFQFIGLDPSRATRDFQAIEQHILGNSMRLNSISSIALDEKWRTTWGREDLVTFNHYGGKLNRKYGYGE
jgi:hypothetical protein